MMEDSKEYENTTQEEAEREEEEILLFDREDGSAEKEDVRKERRGLWLIIGLMAVALVFAVLWLVLDPLGSGKAREEAKRETLITEPLPYGTLDVYAPGTGNASATLLIAPDGTNMLVDCGDEKHYPAVKALLAAHGITHIDTLMLTHMHKDSVEALPLLLDDFSVAEAFMSDQSNTSDASKNALRALENAAVPVTRVLLSPSDTGPMEIAWAENVTVTALSPFEGTYIDANDFSLMLRVAYGNTAVLLPGDAGMAEEKIAMKALPNHYFHATVLMVAQNGDDDATGDKFLSAVRPAYAVIHAKNGSEPDEKLLKRLAAAGTRVLLADTDATVHLALDGIAAEVVE